eukprot:2217845-Pyramimonas_sp.AAC.1
MHASSHLPRAGVAAAAADRLPSCSAPGRHGAHCPACATSSKTSSTSTTSPASEAVALPGAPVASSVSRGTGAPTPMNVSGCADMAKLFGLPQERNSSSCPSSRSSAGLGAKTATRTGGGSYTVKGAGEREGDSRSSRRPSEILRGPFGVELSIGSDQGSRRLLEVLLVT